MSSTTPRPRKVYTLILPVDVANRRVLLGYKKRGFGVGKYNGFGGKVEPGESNLQGAIRELEEESALQCTSDEMQHHGILLLETLADPIPPILEIHTYVATSWTGEPTETDEMRPEWFSFGSSSARTPDTSGDGSCGDSGGATALATDGQQRRRLYPPLPLASMWEETRGWMPVVLSLFLGDDEPVPVPVQNPMQSQIEEKKGKKGIKDDISAGSDGTQKNASLFADARLRSAEDKNKEKEEEKEKRYFLHYVTFVGGMNPQTQVEDAWHAMSHSEYVWYSKPVDGWTVPEVDAWLAAGRERARVSTIDQLAA